ncbi:hypothetical protein MXB_3922, partial [Myxobolus squamalis]
FGEILEAVVIRVKITGASKGYGFVTFKDITSAEKAMLNPYPYIDGRRCYVNYAFMGSKSTYNRFYYYIDSFSHLWTFGRKMEILIKPGLMQGSRTIPPPPVYQSYYDGTNNTNYSYYDQYADPKYLSTLTYTFAHPYLMFLPYPAAHAPGPSFGQFMYEDNSALLENYSGYD